MQSEFEKHVQAAKKVLTGYYVESGFFSEIYPFTTENIAGYINNFDLNNKSLLTVGSSGDQVINAVMNNCNDIDVVDICLFNKYYFYLKKAAIMGLDYEEFQYFFCYYDFPKTFKYNNDVFSRESYYKIKELLKTMDYESFLFWEELFCHYNKKKIREELFKNDEDKIRVLKKTNSYLYDENLYNECKNKIKNINPKFITDDIRKVKLERNYDNIWLSNIGQYLKLEELKKTVDNLSNNLTEEGKMLVCYLYRTTKSTRYNEKWEEIFNLPKVFNLFKGYDLDLISFTGIGGLIYNYHNMKDSVLIYKK